MTAATDQRATLVSQLINSCYRAQDSYRTAASLVEEKTLRRLFEIYAQQRTRFAEELREYLPHDLAPEDHGYGATFAPAGCENATDSIRECLEMDSRTVALYKEALAHRALPTRAHFLISSQL